MGRVVVTFFDEGRGDGRGHYVVVDPAVSVEVAREVVRHRTFAGAVTTPAGRAALWSATVVGAIAGGWGLAWQLAGWREWPSFIVPVGGGAAIGFAVTEWIRSLFGRPSPARRRERATAAAPGAVVDVPVEVRRWAESGTASVAEVVLLARAFVEARSAAMSVEMWARASADESWPHADALVAPVFAAEYEAKRVALDELAARLDFTVPAGLAPSVSD